MVWQRQLVLLALFLGFLALAPRAQVQLPVLNWTELSDWVNVKTDVTPAAVGDGVADDTAALQAAFNRMTATATPPKVVYLPPGTYKITSTLNWPASLGCALIGHGRTTRILWAGGTNMPMMRSRGAARTRFVGIIWDGGNRANGITAIAHNADLKFESSDRHQHEAFVNVNIGILGDIYGDGKYATSEMLIDNCIFSNCNYGMDFRDYNYYNETVTRCVFYNCGEGIGFGAGNGYVRFCHFEGSTGRDIRAGGAHGCSIRHSTSVGSRTFLENPSGQTEISVQDCHISGWTAERAINVTQEAPMMIYDCVFTNPPSATYPPIKLGKNTAIVSNNISAATNGVYTIPSGYTELPAGARGGAVQSADECFFQTSVTVPTVIYDAVRDFGALSGTNDTAAVQACIDAARNHGQGAMAYFPAGRYKLYGTINITGGNYVVGGTGYYTEMEWKGAAPGVMFRVQDAQNVRIEGLGFFTHLMPIGMTAIEQTSTGAASSVFYDWLTLPDGPRTYTGVRSREGLHLVGLPANASVFLGQVNGSVRVNDCGQAKILAEFLNSTGSRIEGATLPKTGFTGVLTGNGGNMMVADNQDLVIADWYCEQSGDWGNIGPDIANIWVSGGTREGTGRVSINGAKAHLVDSDKILRVHDYEGRVAYVEAEFNNQSRYYTVEHQGTRPVDVLLMANGEGNDPLLRTQGSGATFINAQNYHRSCEANPTQWYGNGPAWVSSTQAIDSNGVNHALQFDGANDILAGPFNDTAFQKPTALTAMAWIRPGVSGQDARLLGYYQYNNTGVFAWYLQLTTANKVQMWVKNKATGTTYTSGVSTTTLSPDQWYLVTGVWDGTQVSIYVNDGAAESSAAAAFTELFPGYYERLWMGGRSGGQFFNGTMDEVRIYNRALTQTEIDAHYNYGAGTFGSTSEAGLLAGWHFNEGSGLNAYDYGTGRNHALRYEHNVDHNPSTATASMVAVLDHFRELGGHAYDRVMALNAGLFTLPTDIEVETAAVNVPKGSLLNTLYTQLTGTHLSTIRYWNSQNQAVGYYNGATRQPGPAWIASITETVPSTTYSPPASVCSLRESTSTGPYAYGTLFYNDRNGSNPMQPGATWSTTITPASTVDPDGEWKYFGVAVMATSYFAGYTQRQGTLNVTMTVDGVTCPVESTGNPVSFIFYRDGGPILTVYEYRLPVKPGMPITITFSNLTAQGFNLSNNWGFNLYSLFSN